MPSKVFLTGMTVACQYAAAKQSFSHWEDCCFSIHSCQARFLSMGRLFRVNMQMPSKVFLTGTTVACQYAAAKQGFSQWDGCFLPIRSCQPRFLSMRRLLLANAQLPSKVSLTGTTVACQYAAAKQSFSHWDDCCFSIHSCQARFLPMGRLFRVNTQMQARFLSLGRQLLVNTQVSSKVSLTGTTVACQYAAAKQAFYYWDDCCLSIRSCQARFLSPG